MKPLAQGMLCSVAGVLTAGIGYTLLFFANRKALKHDLYEALYRAQTDATDYSMQRSKEYYDSLKEMAE